MSPSLTSRAGDRRLAGLGSGVVASPGAALVQRRRTPRKSRYAAPASFTTVNAVADVARIAERPSAAARLCTSVARSSPIAVSTAALAPCRMLRASTSACAGPGTTTRSDAAPT